MIVVTDRNEGPAGCFVEYRRALCVHARHSDHASGDGPVEDDVLELRGDADRLAEGKVDTRVVDIP